VTGLSYTRANKQYVAMTKAEVWRFIDSQKIMRVAFVDEDGYPHVTPVWQVAVDGMLYFRATSNKVKAKLAGEAKVCCTLDDGERFTELRGVLIRGRTRVLADAALIRHCTDLIDAKYTGLRSRDLGVPDQWLTARESEAHSMIEVTPERISSWDNSKLASWNPGPQPDPDQTP
jgi:nitroimidazol reductase NimA-like FMN-containing flavoprotein (pyridoxamine 5'-phosphate oxidase superfamily)